MSVERALRSGMSIRFGLIALIVLTMLIPLAMVRGVTEDRQSYFDATLADVAGAWGQAQMLTGPFLVVPEMHRVTSATDDGRTRVRMVSRERVYLPATLNLEFEVRHQIRHRAIYDVPVYTAIARVHGTFAPIDTEAAGSPDITLQADRARLVLGISHTQSIGSATPVTIGEAEYPFAAGAGQPWMGSGVHAVLGSLEDRGEIPFSFELVVKGTRQLGFTPVGQDTRVHVRSSWPHPSFEGRYLPDRYQVDDQGFEADWQIGALARSLPGSFSADAAPETMQAEGAWVRLFQPVTAYTLVERATKYGLVFIALTFLAFVCFELNLGLRFHPVQYGVVGLALVLFYLALLSLSEHVDFGMSYGVATALLTTLIGWYVWAMTRSAGTTAWLAGVVSALYGTLFVLLRLEAFALLVGTAVLVVGLVALMFSTRTLTDGEPGRQRAEETDS